MRLIPSIAGGCGCWRWCSGQGDLHGLPDNLDRIVGGGDVGAPAALEPTRQGALL
jgi:hypothetical protein